MDPKTQFLTNNNLTRKRWAKDLFRIVLPAVEFNYLVGKGTDSIVQMRTELGKGEGDQITFGIRLPLVGEGRVGNDSIEGHEEGLRFRDFNCTIEELNHAVDTGGKMEEQRVPYDLMAEAKSGLQDWWADKLSDHVINTLCGIVGYRIAGQVFANAPDAPDANHFLTPNAVAEAAIGAADLVDLSFLDLLKQRAETINMLADEHYKIRPLKINGKQYYRVILHNYVFDMLKQNTNIAMWGDLLRSAGKLQQEQVEFEYNGLLVSKSERCPTTFANVYRGVLLGQQAGVWAWGGAGDSKSTTMAFHPYTRDADRFLMVRGGGIFGMRKVRFANIDFGALTFASFGAALT
jgi:N4-gp56 family major capsid protein